MNPLRLAFRLSMLALSWAWAGTLPAQAQQQHYTRQFAGSTVLLASGDTLQGPLTLRPEQDVLLMAQPDGTITTLSAVAVLSFAVKGETTSASRGAGYYDNFYDARNGYYYGNPTYGSGLRPRTEANNPNLVRVFRTFRWNHGNDYSDFTSPAFFEQLSNGPRLLLRRESLVTRTTNAGPYGYGPYGGYGGYAGMPRYGTYSAIKDEFYLATPTGAIIALRNPKKDLLNVFRGQSKQIEQYAKQNRLDFTVARELAFIVNYANSLVKE